MSSRRQSGSGPTPLAIGGPIAGPASSAGASTAASSSEGRGRGWRIARSLDEPCPRRPTALEPGADYHPAVRSLAGRRVAGALLAVALTACDPSPSPSASGGIVAPPVTPAPTSGASGAPTPSPTAASPASFPLAVVTGVQTRTSVIDVDELATLAASGELVVPCGIAVSEPALAATVDCIPADQLAAAIEADEDLVALLPPGLVEPATKVLPIAGDGPFGLFGADLFGDPAARALPYPIVGAATAEAVLDPAWLAYE